MTGNVNGRKYYKEDNKCPNCGHDLDSATSVDSEDVMPREGDITICIKCATILRLDKDLTTRLLTGEQTTEYKLDVELWNQVQNVVNTIKKFSSCKD